MRFIAASRWFGLQTACAALCMRNIHTTARAFSTVRPTMPHVFASTFHSALADVHLVPMFNDNYGFIVVDKLSGQSACVDPGDGFIMAEALQKLQLNLTMIWCTHKHMDHIGGVVDLKRAFPSAQVIGTKYESIPGLDIPVGDLDTFSLGGLPVKVLYTPCHTKGHIAFLVNPSDTVTHISTSGENNPLDVPAPLLFCGDTLFVGGCGRFFEGTAADMLQNMDRFASLPPQTQVFCAHEYTESNLKFLTSVESSSERSATSSTGAVVDRPASAVYEEVIHRRLQNLPTVPTTIGKELQYNLFMKCREQRTQQLVGASTAEEAMAKLRAMKNAF